MSPAQAIPRTAIVDCTLNGVHVPAGETVMASIPGANRDPAQYEKPDELDISRGRPHLALGIGSSSAWARR